MEYMVECFNETNKTFHFKVDSADGYCAELEVRKKYPNYKIGEVVRLEDLNKPYENFTDKEMKKLGDNY